MFIKYLLAALLLCGIGFVAKADQGCILSGDSYIYYKEKYSGYGIYSKSNSFRISLASAYCEYDTGDYCLLERSSGSNNYDFGSVYYFSFVDCPLDDHIGILLALATGVGLLHLRKRKIGKPSF